MEESEIVFYCPQCGEKSLGRLGATEFHCERCGFTAFRNVAAAVGAIVARDGKILVTRRAKEPGAGMLDLPGGFVEDGETLEEAVRREVREELGLEIGNVSYFGSFPNTYSFKGIDYSTVDGIFVCHVDSEPTRQEAEEIAEWMFLDSKTLSLDDVAFPSIREALRRYRDRD
ncbi:NUDIX domain-containing protein [Candidatus Sumerlaeota bacterium]|nr:NUDIX domain-containing protein [Candidatus Sumerlaeota bacterium]